MMINQYFYFWHYLRATASLIELGRKSFKSSTVFVLNNFTWGEQKTGYKRVLVKVSLSKTLVASTKTTPLLPWSLDHSFLHVLSKAMRNRPCVLVKSFLRRWIQEKASIEFMNMNIHLSNWLVKLHWFETGKSNKRKVEILYLIMRNWKVTHLTNI